MRLTTIHFDIISMDVSTLYFKGLPINPFPENYACLSLKIFSILTNRADPDKTQPSGSSLFAKVAV